MDMENKGASHFPYLSPYVRENRDTEIHAMVLMAVKEERYVNDRREAVRNSIEEMITPI